MPPDTPTESVAAAASFSDINVVSTDSMQSHSPTSPAQQQHLFTPLSQNPASMDVGRSPLSPVHKDEVLQQTLHDVLAPVAPPARQPTRRRSPDRRQGLHAAQRLQDRDQRVIADSGTILSFADVRSSMDACDDNGQ